MKEIYLVAALTVTTLTVALDVSSSDIHTKCPEVDPINSTVHLPYETDCTKFYMCSMGRKIEMSCPIMDTKGNRLHFNPKLQICDIPQKVKCVQSTTLSTIVVDNVSTIVSTMDKVATSTATSSITPISYTCPPKGSTERRRLLHECSCTFYYECIDELLVLKKCPKGQHYDYVSQTCGDPDIVNCTRLIPSITVATKSTTMSITPTMSTTFSTTISTITSADSNICPPKGSTKRVTWPHDYSCTLYYQCFDGQVICRKCPEGMHYDHNSEVCDYSVMFKCIRPIPSTTTTTKVTIASTSTTSATTTKTPSESTTIKTTTEKNTIKPTVKPPPIHQKCKKNKIHRIPHEYNCRFFYICFFGVKFLFRCSHDWRFNPKLGICDLPENVPCSKSFRFEQAAIESSTTCIGTCPFQDPLNHTVLLSNVDCKKFCMCSHGSAYVHNCPADLYFDSIKKVCDYLTNVVCEVKSDSQDDFRVDKEVNEDGNLLQYLDEKNEDERKIRGNFWF